jgi:hypothetical protein
MPDIRVHRRNRISGYRRIIEPEVVGMAYWWFVECGWCGYTGCAAPVGDSCPRCQHSLAVETPPAPASDEASGTAA